MSTVVRRRPPTRLVIAVGVVAAVVIGATLWWFFIREDAPAAFDIDDAVGDITPDVSDTSTTALTSADGVWTVDPDAGDTAAGFRVDEELSTIGATTAVGRTSDVTAEVTIDGETVTTAEVIVDMSTLETDESRHDGRMRDALAVDEFPTATFRLTEPLQLPSAPLDGETISVTATGQLTIKGVTRPVQVELDARVVDGTLVIVGSMPVVFADYGVETPTAAIVLSVADQGTIEFQLFLTKT